MQKSKRVERDPLQPKNSREYRLHLLRRPGVTCCSIYGGGNYYSINGEYEKVGQITKPFHDKKRMRGEILIKLGIWKVGQDSRQLKKHR